MAILKTFGPPEFECCLFKEQVYLKHGPRLFKRQDPLFFIKPSFVRDESKSKSSYVTKAA